MVVSLKVLGAVSLIVLGTDISPRFDKLTNGCTL